MLRALLAEHGPGRIPKERGRCAAWRGFLRRNPTEAERALWQALVNDRRFAGRGFLSARRRSGKNICDFVSFPCGSSSISYRPTKLPAAAATRAQKRAWLEDHNLHGGRNICRRCRV